MNYENKKQFVENFILLGLDLEESMLHAEMSDDEIKKAQEDTNFIKRIEYIIRENQRRLITLFNKTAERCAVQKDDWRAALALLEINFPEKYKKGSKSEKTNKVKNVTHIYLPDNGR